MLTWVRADVGQSNEAVEVQRPAFEVRRNLSAASVPRGSGRGGHLSAALPSGHSDRKPAQFAAGRVVSGARTLLLWARYHRGGWARLGTTVRFGRRLDPGTDGRPDSRPKVRENARVLGNLVKDFDFTQKPRRTFLLPRIPPSKFPPNLIPVLKNH